VFNEFSTGTGFASEVGISGNYRASGIAQTEFRINRITASAGKDTTSGFSNGGATSRWTDGLFFEGGVGTGFVTFKFLLSGDIEGEDTVGFDFEFDSEDEYCCSGSAGEVFRGPTSVNGLRSRCCRSSRSTVKQPATTLSLSRRNSPDPLRSAEKKQAIFPLILVTRRF
jgi:hypothetical protein